MVKVLEAIILKLIFKKISTITLNIHHLLTYTRTYYKGIRSPMGERERERETEGEKTWNKRLKVLYLKMI